MDSDIFTQQFRDAIISGTEKKRVLILGSGYGTMAYSLLENSRHNATKFVVNDLSSEHMDIFRDQLPAEFDGRVTIISGNFLEQADFPDMHFNLILMNNVLHFFNPSQVGLCLDKIYGWLKPGGSAMVTACSPYWKIYEGEGNHIQTFEYKKASGDEFPGFIEDLRAFFVGINSPMAARAPTGSMLTSDPDTLTRQFLQHRFNVIQASFFASPKTLPPFMHGDGREHVGIVARRPAP